MRNSFQALITTLFFLSGSELHADDEATRMRVNDSLDFMREVYDTMYAPAGWKQDHFGWNLNSEIEKAKMLTELSTRLQPSDVREIFKSFIYSMKDYHTSIAFLSTEKANLPFTVQNANGKFLLAFIDRAKLPLQSFPFVAGDELVNFGSQTTAEAVAGVQAEIPANVPETDFDLATMRLTSRTASRGLKVPQGPITLGIKSMGSNEIQNIQLIWNYSPELIDSTKEFLPSPVKDSKNSQFPGASILNRSFKVDLDVAATKPQSDNPFLLGTRDGFLPDLGHKIWQSDENDPFRAYIFMTADRKLFGYVRIPSYAPDSTEQALNSFAKIIAKFEANTDAIVIDQLNNPGGSVFYLYTLASMLSNQPLRTPRHQMKITQADEAEALSMIDALSSITNDNQAQGNLGPDFGGYPMSFTLAQFFLNYAKFIVSEFKAGRTLTDPYWIAGIDHINPIGLAYSKPILFLTNHLDFSGGDFMPAILQDNKRVVTMGTRTAGAGGYVLDHGFPNNIGIASFRTTGSIAKRVDGNPIENLGVTPELNLEPTELDYATGFSVYGAKVVEQLKSMIQK